MFLRQRTPRSLPLVASALCTCLFVPAGLRAQSDIPAAKPVPAGGPAAETAPPLPGEEIRPGSENLSVFERVLVGDPVPKATLEEAIAEEKKKGASDQSIAEIRFVWAYQSNSDKEVAAVLPSISKLTKTFEEKNSPMGLKQTDWDGICEYVRAVAAKEKGDMDGFKKHLLEAIWRSPEQSTIFLRPLVDIRAEADAKAMADAIRKIKPDLAQSFKTTDGKSHTLGGMLKGKKALLIDFWMRACPICQDSMPNFAAKSKYLAKYGVASAAVNIADSAEDSEKVRKEFKVNDPWFAEGTGGYLAKTFLATETPHTVLIDATGKVRFAGFPLDPALWEELQKIDPKIQPADPEPLPLGP